MLTKNRANTLLLIATLFALFLSSCRKNNAPKAQDSKTQDSKTQDSKTQDLSLDELINRNPCSFSMLNNPNSQSCPIIAQEGPTFKCFTTLDLNQRNLTVRFLIDKQFLENNINKKVPNHCSSIPLREGKLDKTVISKYECSEELMLHLKNQPNSCDILNSELQYFNSLEHPNQKVIPCLIKASKTQLDEGYLVIDRSIIIDRIEKLKKEMQINKCN